MTGSLKDLLDQGCTYSRLGLGKAASSRQQGDCIFSKKECLNAVSSFMSIIQASDPLSTKFMTTD